MAAGNGRNSGTASAKGLSSFVLKVVAIVGMTCNHAAYVFAGHLPFVGECVLFAVGGVTFPVMAYLLVEGYRHTSNVKRYVCAWQRSRPCRSSLCTVSRVECERVVHVAHRVGTSLPGRSRVQPRVVRGGRGGGRRSSASSATGVF